MAILIDADVVIEAERGTFDLFGWLASHPDEEFKMAAITVRVISWLVKLNAPIVIRVSWNTATTAATP